MNYVYEILISKKVSFEEVAAIVSSYLNIPGEKIGIFDEYLERLETTDELQIGINIYFYNRGYKTFIDVSHFRFGLENSRLIELAYRLAVGFKSDVALADETDDGGFGYLIISPDRQYQKAYGFASRKEGEVDEITEFTIYTEKADLSEYLSLLGDL